jgi:hypothetical protein
MDRRPYSSEPKGLIMLNEQQILREAWLYRYKHPRRVISADCENYPGLRELYRYALGVCSQRPKAKQFKHEGVRYAIVWLGERMCVMHLRTMRVLVGAPGDKS